MFLFILYFIFFEFVSFLRDGMGYIKDVFNWLDISSFGLNIYLAFLTATDFREKDDIQYDRRGLAALAVVLMWFKAFYWMRLFTGTSFYVRLIRETLYDIRFFALLFICILATFGNALYVMSQGRPDDEMLYADIFGWRVLSTLLNQYMLSLGEFDTEAYQSDGEDIVVWTIFIATTFITQITFLNMLIAVMGDTFDRVSEVKEQSALAEKIQILADYVIIVRRESIKTNDLNKFIFAVKPKSMGSDEQGGWEGTVTQLKKANEASTAQVKSAFNRRLGQVQGEVARVTQKLGTMDDRMNDIAGNVQRIMTMLKSSDKAKQSQDNAGADADAAAKDAQSNLVTRNAAAATVLESEYN